MEIDQAIRRLLALFRLPGEAQKIDRMMEAFAAAYCQDNPEHTHFGNTNTGKVPPQDLALIIAFSTIMLHTDAHSREIKQDNKMTRDEFVRNNRGVPGGDQIPVEFIGAIYDRVVAEEWITTDISGGT